MKRCPRCAEKVRSAAALCPHCRHGFGSVDRIDAFGDTFNDAFKWISGMALVIAGLWLLSMFVTDYNRTQQQLNASTAAK